MSSWTAIHQHVTLRSLSFGPYRSQAACHLPQSSIHSSCSIYRGGNPPPSFPISPEKHVSIPNVMLVDQVWNFACHLHCTSPCSARNSFSSFWNTLN